MPNRSNRPQILRGFVDSLTAVDVVLQIATIPEDIMLRQASNLLNDAIDLIEQAARAASVADTRAFA